MPVTPNEDIEGQHDAVCTVDRCNFVSRGHPTKKSAESRLKEHKAEHAQAEEAADEEGDG